MVASPKPLRVIFAGTPEFASVALADLLAAGFEVPLVLTQPDRPAGRGMKLQASAVKLLAQQHGIQVAQPRSLRLDGKYPEDAAMAQSAVHAAAADAMVVAAYGLMLPQWVLAAPRLKCFNIHASLLPRWRGAAPIHRAIEAGDTHTGVTIMQMDIGLDTGDMLLTEQVAIAEDDTTALLHDKLAALGGPMMVQVLRSAAAGDLHPTVQPASGITYAHKIDKTEALIDWSQPADVLERRIRAFNPFPGAATVLGLESIKVWAAKLPDTEFKNDSYVSILIGGKGLIKQITPTQIAVQTGCGTLLLTTLQRAGGKRLPVGDFLHGFALKEGMVLGSTTAPTQSRL
jgi:methionyl-tRNA formyltransferase